MVLCSHSSHRKKKHQRPKGVRKEAKEKKLYRPDLHVEGGEPRFDGTVSSIEPSDLRQYEGWWMQMFVRRRRRRSTTSDWEDNSSAENP